MSLLHHPTFKLVLAAVALLVAAFAYFGLYLPLSTPMASLPARGTVIGKTFQKAHTKGVRGTGMHANGQVRVGDRYLLDIRLESGEVVRAVWPVTVNETMPVGQAVSVRYQRRELMFFGTKTYVTGLSPLEE